VDALPSQEGKGLIDFTEAREEKREIMVVIKLLNVNLRVIASESPSFAAIKHGRSAYLPIDFVSLGIMIDRYRKVSTIIQLTET
jgi:hypothetical protein